MTITAAADGSALGNPGPAGWAWYVDDSCWAAGGWKHATNNQGELKAVLELFRATAHLDDDLLVLCDSQYVINSVTKWMKGWKAKGWRKGDGKPVMNLDLLQEIDEAIAGRRYRFEWVKGHVGHPLNEAADVRARGAAEAFQRGRSAPAGPGFRGVQAGTEPKVPPRAAASAGSSAPTLTTERVTERAGAYAHDELFSFDDLDDLNQEVGEDYRDLTDPHGPDAMRSNGELHRVTLSLSTAEHRRVVQRAAVSGVTVEEYLRGLI
ncbi:RNase H family protein [Cryobacterium sp. PH31-O1]|uniref:RNase H family protein n=1 Tax=Cryobacterium sp. PH31-O1 TaxID=3046306 RepID=UPI0024BBADF7|nr:RNase H family protein [Cryobacterium sp. PH31-O1]MDJ0339163.1 ribonuclease HI [Cryobacterium sp. PH31-O1]